MNTTEHSEQKMFIKWFRSKFADRIIAIPNGGKRQIGVAIKLKNEGVLKGVPDLFIPSWRLWIEMKKDKKGKLSPYQKDWIDYLNGLGYQAHIAYGCADAIKIVETFLSNYGDSK